MSTKGGKKEIRASFEEIGSVREMHSDQNSYSVSAGKGRHKTTITQQGHTDGLLCLVERRRGEDGHCSPRGL